MKVITNIRKAIIRGAIFAYCKIVYRAKIIGTENIPRRERFYFVQIIKVF